MEPRGSQNTARLSRKLEKMLTDAPKGHRMAPKSPQVGLPSRFWPNFGYPLGPKNQAQIDFLQKRDLQWLFSCQFLWQTLIFSFLARFFIEKLCKIDGKINTFFCACVYFSTLAKPQVRRQGQCFQHFSLFSFLKNFAKKRPKTMWNWNPPK